MYIGSRRSVLAGFLAVVVGACGTTTPTSPERASATPSTSQVLPTLTAPATSPGAFAPPAQATPSPSDPASRVARVFDSFHEGKPGCAVAISNSGNVVYSQGFGTADLATMAPITPTTVFRVASVSKQFTAAAILLLAQEGAISLDDDIHTYVPELATYGQALPLRDLVWMESGLSDRPYADIRPDASDVVTAKDILSVLAKVTKLDFEPGSQFAYTNANYFLLRLVVDRVTHVGLAAYANDRIFRPLGMTTSSFQDDAGPPPTGDATGYEIDRNFAFTPVFDH